MSEHDQSSTDKMSSFHQRRAQSVDAGLLNALNREIDGQRDKFANHGANGSHFHTISEDEVHLNGALTSRTRSRTATVKRWRSRCCFAPSPHCNFGPRATLEKVQNDQELIIIQDPSSQRLHWTSPPSNILIIRKPGQSTVPEFRLLVVNLLKRDLTVYIGSADLSHLSSDNDSQPKGLDKSCVVFDEERDTSKIDLVVCLGGDGTLLHASSVFQKSCPPILSFSLGSLGFLTPFDFQHHNKILNQVLSGNVAVLLRTRLSCEINKVTSQDGSSTTDDIHLVLNEVVIDRGPNSYLSNVDLYINDKFITKVQGDGLIVSTPTGSTAYGMAAGASMVHPNVPAMIICPICPHSLSFRPIVVPAGLELGVKVSEDSRLTAWLSIDGRSRLELRQEDSIKITTSAYPIPSICRFDQSGDWFESLANILHWNLRKPQSSLESDQEMQNDSGSQSPDDEHNHSNAVSKQNSQTETTF